MNNIYLDNAATSPLDPQVLELLHELNKNLFANPSSLHSLGRKAKKELEKARQKIASSINAQSEEIFFCSGASEANNTVFHLADYDYIITSPSEHPCVLEAAKKQNKQTHWLNLDTEGFINLDELKKLLATNPGRALVSIMHANNEIGTIQDISTIAQICKKHSALFHSDCVQSWLKHPIDASEIDFITASAHKAHGPKGVGFLYKKTSAPLKNEALILGGGQENGLRAGTENLINIIAMAALTEIDPQIQFVRGLQKKLITALEKIPGCKINGPKNPEQRLVNNINFALSASKLSSEQLVLQLDLAGFCVSSGSACSSTKAASEIESSYVLRAIRADQAIAEKSIRVSLSRFNTGKEIEAFVNKLCAL